MEVNDIVLFDFDAFISGSKDVDYQEAIKKMSLSLMKFLIENDLLVNRRPRRPNPAADYRVQMRRIGPLNPYPCPRERQGSGNRLPIRLGRQPRPCRQPPQHHLLRLQRQRPNHRPAPMESTD